MLLVMLPTLFSVGCQPETPCRTNSDCVLHADSGRLGICSAHGFCRRECNLAEDCPCGSFCAACGVCVRNDLAGPATCFGLDNFHSDAELVGACVGSAPPPAARDDCPNDVTAPVCNRVDGGRDAAEAAPLDAGPSTDPSEPPADAGAADTDAGRGGDAAAPLPDASMDSGVTS